MFDLGGGGNPLAPSRKMPHCVTFNVYKAECLTAIEHNNSGAGSGLELPCWGSDPPNPHSKNELQYFLNMFNFLKCALFWVGGVPFFRVVGGAHFFGGGVKFVSIGIYLIVICKYSGILNGWEYRYLGSCSYFFGPIYLNS